MTSQTKKTRRKLLLALRRSVVAHRQFDVQLSDDGEHELQTCRTCGHTIKAPVTDVYGGASGALRKRMAAYRSQGSISGKCPQCTKQLRDEKYPLE